LTIAPVAGTPPIRSEPTPFCQIRTTIPNAAPIDSTFSKIALIGSTIERCERASRPKVTRAMIATISGNDE